MKKLMKKPSAARPKMNKSSARIKRPSSGYGINPAARSKACRERKKKKLRELEEKGIPKNVKRKKQNVRAQARRAARNGLPYQTKLPEFGDVADVAYAAEAAAYDAEVKSRKAMERADSAHEAADSAREAANKAKEDAADARAMAFENNKQILSLAGKVKTDAADARAMVSENNKQIISLAGKVKTGLESFAKTAALAQRNEERLNTDDRQRGYVTPEQKMSCIH